MREGIECCATQCYSWELVLGVEDAEDGTVRCQLGGSRALFTAGTMQRMANHLQACNFCRPGQGLALESL